MSIMIFIGNLKRRKDRKNVWYPLLIPTNLENSHSFACNLENFPKIKYQKLFWNPVNMQNLSFEKNLEKNVMPPLLLPEVSKSQEPQFYDFYELFATARSVCQSFPKTKTFKIN